jgi:hypothetical protein
LSPSPARGNPNRQDFPRQYYGGANYPAGPYSNGGKSILFNIVQNTELSRTINAPYGIANNFTVMCWVKPIPGIATAMNIISCGNTTEMTDTWELSCRNSAENFRMIMFGNDGGNSEIRDYRFGTIPTEPDPGVWTMIGAVWDGDLAGGNGLLTTYQDGVVVVPSFEGGVGDPGSITDASRQGGLGVNGRGTDSTVFDGHIHSVALWDISQDEDNILAMYNGGNGDGFNLQEDSGNYSTSASLAQLWLLGTRGSPNLGNTVVGAGTYHMNIETNLTDDDIVDDAPTG